MTRTEEDVRNLYNIYEFYHAVAADNPNLFRHHHHCVRRGPLPWGRCGATSNATSLAVF